LLKAGAEIRVKKSFDATRIILRGNTLFFSCSSEISKVVHNGIIYTGRQTNDPLIEYYSIQFSKDFSKGRKVTLNKKNKITYSDNTIKHIYYALKALQTKDWIIIVLSVIFGTILGYIVK